MASLYTDVYKRQYKYRTGIVDRRMREWLGRSNSGRGQLSQILVLQVRIIEDCGTYVDLAQCMSVNKHI